MFELARGYRERRHDRVRRAPGARVRARGGRLHGDAPPARGRRRLLRRGRCGHCGESSTLALPGRPKKPSSRRELRETMPSAVELLAPRDDEILSREALDFVARLHRELNPIRRSSCSSAGASARPSSTPARSRTSCPRRAACARRLARRAGAAGPPRPPGRDHRPGRPQDDDQRAQLGRARLHGRLRGRAARRRGRTSSRASATSPTPFAARSSSRPRRRPTG